MSNKEAFIIINNIIYHNEKYEQNKVDEAVKTIRKTINDFNETRICTSHSTRQENSRTEELDT